MSRLSEVFLTPETHRAACRGEPAACRAIYEAVSGPVHALVRRLVGAGAAEDVFQDAMMRSFERLGDYRSEAPFGMWVRAIAVNACLMHLRSPWRRLRSQLAVGGPRPSRDPEGASTLDGDAVLDGAALEAFDPARDRAAARLDVERLLAGLSPVARTVLWLHDIEGYSHEDIARAFGRTPSFSKSQLARAHARLRELVAAPTARSAAGWSGLLKVIP